MSDKAQVGPWGAVPTALLQEPGITLNRLRVYTALSSYQGRDETCWPSIAKIAERAGVPRGAVSECTRWLEETGWIAKRRRANERQTTVYAVSMEIVDDPEVRESRKSGGSGNPGVPEYARSPGVPDFPLYENNRENNTSAPAEPSPHKQVIDAYHRLHKEKTGDVPTINGKAGKSVQRLLQKHDVDKIIAKLRKYYERDEWYTRGGRDISLFESHYDRIPLPRPDTRLVLECPECGAETAERCCGRDPVAREVAV